MYCSDLLVGDLVCVKCWNTDDLDSGWISPPSDFGVIIEVIEVDYEFVFIERKTRCYDYVIYWIVKEQKETLPDIIIEKYTDLLRRENER